MKLPDVHISVLFFSKLLQVFCLLFLFLLELCIPAVALSSEPAGRAVQPPISVHHFHGVIRLPVSHRNVSDIHKSRGRGRRTLDSTPQSEVITLNQRLTQFFATLQIGTPPQDIALIIDTGSELLWIQCMPCLQCTPQAPGFPIFNPAESSSFQSLPCTAPICSGDGTVYNTTDSCSDSIACRYLVLYADNSNSTGILAQEPLTFETTAATVTSTTPVVSGCGNDNEGVEAQLSASGMMGLSRGRFSIISQLSIDVFSYCLPDRTSTTYVTGYLTLGSVSESSTPVTLQYTPMIQNSFATLFSQFYYVTITGISINGQVLDIPSAAFEINATSGWGGTIVDSGTTFTFLVDEAFAVFIQAFENATTASPTRSDLEEGILCYGVPFSEQAAAVTIHFDGSLDMDLGTNHIFYLDDANTDYCLAFGNARLVGLNFNIIGNQQQQNFLMEFDIANSRIGMAPTQCSQRY